MELMEGTGQNFFVPETLDAVELHPDWEAVTFEGNPALIDFEELDCGECAFINDLQLSCPGEDFNALTVDLALSEFSLILEEMILAEGPPDLTGDMAEPAPNDEFSGNAVCGMEKHMVKHENAATELVAPEPRPVVADGESIGVTLHRRNKLNEAHLWLRRRQISKGCKKGLQLFLGAFTTAYEAKRTHDLAAIKLDVRETARGKPYPLNFPESTYAADMAEHSDWSARDFLWKLRRASSKFNKGKSRMKGVTVRKNLKGGVRYEAKISQKSSEGRKRTFDLGKFESEEEAGMAYDQALLFLKGADEFTCITNFRPSRYCAADVQRAGSSLGS